MRRHTYNVLETGCGRMRFPPQFMLYQAPCEDVLAPAPTVRNNTFPPTSKRKGTRFRSLRSSSLASILSVSPFVEGLTVARVYGHEHWPAHAVTMNWRITREAGKTNPLTCCIWIRRHYINNCSVRELSTVFNHGNKAYINHYWCCINNSRPMTLPCNSNAMC